MAGKYYAVKAGKKTGIFRTWEECKASVNGYSGAIYKSFKTKEEADAYLGGAAGQAPVGEKPGQEKGMGDAPAPVRKLSVGKRKEREKNMEEDGWKAPDCVKIYVDGSFNKATGEFSYGMVVLGRDGEEKLYQKFQDKALSSMRNVAGEIKGAEAAMQYAIDHKLAAIEIYHDYEGIARWCLGEWQANKEGTKAYKAFFDQASTQVDIRFVKVAGHSNDKYNDMADGLAKEALGL